MAVSYTHLDRCECGVRTVRGIETARGNTDAGGDEAGDAQNEVDESKDFESLASEAHGWSFRYNQFFLYFSVLFLF